MQQDRAVVCAVQTFVARDTGIVTLAGEH
jgi:hypothetical protein